MSDALVRLKEHLSTLKPAERAAADYILTNPAEASRISIYTLAKNAYVSPSAVVRLCHTVGFSGFKEFRRSLLTELAAAHCRKGNRKIRYNRRDHPQDHNDQYSVVV